uniref:Ovule protein n=1 Tax=Romanomermis culicivorax TaxID=13658 RepID=A0A915J6S8_ROMCU
MMVDITNGYKKIHVKLKNLSWEHLLISWKNSKFELILDSFQVRHQIYIIWMLKISTFSKELKMQNFLAAWHRP